MSSIAVELFFLLVLILANGAFAMAEVAIVASRKTRLQQRALDGDARSGVAFELAQSPNRFLASVQIGITLIGILAGAFGGATLSRQLAEALRAFPVVAPYADSIALGAVVLGITYLSLIVGELVPKRIALQDPERIASIIAVPMRTLSVIASPIVSFLSASTDVVVRVLRLQDREEPSVTEEEINAMIEHGRRAGVFAAAEQDLVQRVFRLGDKSVSALLTRRIDVEWLDVNDAWDVNRRKLIDSDHAHLPVGRGSLEEILGVVYAKDLLDEYLAGRTPELTTDLKAPLYVPETLPAFKLLETFKAHRAQLIFAIDEHGAFQGLVSLHDVLCAIVGDLPTVDEPDEPDAVQREDGSWLLAGTIPIDDFKAVLDLANVPSEGSYHTLSGLIMLQFGRVPTAGDHFDMDGLRIEVVDMDGHRIDKVLVERVSEG